MKSYPEGNLDDHLHCCQSWRCYRNRRDRFSSMSVRTVISPSLPCCISTLLLALLCHFKSNQQSVHDDLFTILPFQMEVISRVHSTVHSLLVSCDPAFDGRALRSRSHSKLLQVINVYYRAVCGRAGPWCCLLDGKKTAIYWKCKQQNLIIWTADAQHCRSCIREPQELCSPQGALSMPSNVGGTKVASALGALCPGEKNVFHWEYWGDWASNMVDEKLVGNGVQLDLDIHSQILTCALESETST